MIMDIIDEDDDDGGGDAQSTAHPGPVGAAAAEAE